MEKINVLQKNFPVNRMVLGIKRLAALSAFLLVIPAAHADKQDNAYNQYSSTTGTSTSTDTPVTVVQPGLVPLPSATSSTDAVDLSNAFEVREGHLPPLGYARPPFHIIPNATTGPTGLNLKQIRQFYGYDQLTNNQGQGQTIGIIDAYDDPNIAHDLAYFVSQMQLGQACSNFKVIYANGSKPVTNAGWALEMALDVEWACAIAPQASILLVEAASNSYNDLMHAVDVAIKNGASVVSMSWGGSEFSGETTYDSHFAKTGVIFTASSGDSGTGVEYPAASPFVVGVGGTTTTTDTETTADSADAQNDYYDYFNEVAWSGSGGGQSKYEKAPQYQINFLKTGSTQQRGVPDVAYDGDPNTGVAVYSSVKYNGQSGWFQIGGTSVGAPQWAALFAIANSLRVESGKNRLSTNPASASGSPIYSAATTSSYPADYHDIIQGSNGICGSLCNTNLGYDYVTGLGSPQANNIVPALANQ